jgi:hypothetical protein
LSLHFEKGWSNTTGFLGAHACQLQAVEPVFFAVKDSTQDQLPQGNQLIRSIVLIIAILSLGMSSATRADLNKGKDDKSLP